MATKQADTVQLRSGKQLTEPKVPQKKAAGKDTIKESTTVDQQTDPKLLLPKKMSGIGTTQEMPMDNSNDTVVEAPIVNSNPIGQSSQADVGTNSAKARDKERASKPYPHHGDDPDPVTQILNKRDYGEYVTKLTNYTHNMYASYMRTKSIRGELMWQDFASAFRPHTVRTWSRTMVTEWKALLSSRDVYLNLDRERDQHEVIIDVLYRSKHVSATEQLRANDSPSIPNETDNKADHDGQATEADHDGQSTGEQPNDKPLDEPAGSPSVNEEVTIQPSMKQVNPNEPDDDGGDDSSSSSSDEGDDKSSRNKKSGYSKKAVTICDPDSHAEELSTGTSKTTTDERHCINSLVKAYQGKPVYSGAFLDDFEEVLEAFETIAEVCDVTSDHAKRKSIPIMLKGAAFRKYSRSKHNATTYEDSIKLLRTMFSSKERQTRLLKEWKEMKLTEAMGLEPSKSEIDVFKVFVDKATAMQQQLHITYQDDRQLRDMLSIAIDIPRIQEFLSDRQPRNTHQLVERVANRLSHKPRTAGATAAFLSSQDNHNGDDDNDDLAMYTLGQKYGGAARRNVKMFGRPRGRGGPVRSHDNQRRRPLPKWLRAVKGCMVCGGAHRANERHPREEVTKAVKRLKMEHPTAMLSVEEEAFIAEMFDHHNQPDNDQALITVNELEGEDGDFDVENDTVTNSNEEAFNADYSEVTYLSTEDAEGLEVFLSNTSFLHGRTVTNTRPKILSAMHVTGISSSLSKFKGLLLDTCCNRTSVMGRQQYVSYCDEFNIKPSIQPIKNRSMNGIGGKTKGVGIVLIDIPFVDLRLNLPITFLLVEGEQPALMSMRDMKSNGLEISIQDETISFNGRTQKLAFENFFLIHRWAIEDLDFALYTEKELRTIHKTFGHPAVRTTERLIRRAQGNNLDWATKKAIQSIADECRICQRLHAAPRRFKLTVGMDDMRFNHSVQVDTMFISSRPVCHMVDEATHFTSASFLKTQSTSEIWKTIQNLWCLVYLGPPDFLHVDQGSAYVSKEMRGLCEANGVVLREAPIETPGAIGVVERYHAPLRAAFQKLRTDLDGTTSDSECLRMAVYAVNNTIGPEGLCPTLLVFGTLPRPIRTRPSPTQLQRATAVESAMTEVAKEQAKRRLSFGLRHTGGPKRGEMTKDLEALPAGSRVAIYRVKSGEWEGPHLFVSVDGETAVVQTRRGRRIFRSVCVKPWIKTTPKSAWTRRDDTENGNQAYPVYATKPPKGKTSKHPTMFQVSRKAEIDGLVSNGTLKLVDASTVPKGMRIFGSRFIDELKVRAEGTRRKSRLVAQNYSDQDATEIATKAPTIQRFTQRLMLSLAASLQAMTLFTRDVNQAYLQSETQLERPVYIKAPPDMNLPPSTVLHVVKPLYGIPESGLHWYLTYLTYHEEKLGMKRSVVDPCFLMKHNDKHELIGAIILQVDDSLAFGTNAFLSEEEEASQHFKTKPRMMLSNNPVTFNGVRLYKGQNDMLIMEQKDKVDKLENPITQEQFTSTRAMMQYIGVNCRPEICANVQLVAPGAKPSTKDEFSVLRKVIKYLQQSPKQGLKFVNLDIDTVKICVVSDASFANAKDSKSQLGFLVLMVDGNRRANVIHYGSNRCRRVTRSVMASELHALILAFDYAFISKSMLEEALRRPIEIEAFLDSKTVFDVVAKDGKTTERRLQIDIHALRESCDKGEISRLAWIPGQNNPADAMTKLANNVNRDGSTKQSPLMTLLQKNEFNPTPIGWSDVSHSQPNESLRIEKGGDTTVM